MDWKRNFLESSLLRRSTNKNNPNEVQAKCVDLAYKDMMTLDATIVPYFCIRERKYVVIQMKQ